MSRVILTTLGAGQYEEATYIWQDHPPVRTKLVSAALQAWLPGAEVKVLLTPLARERNSELLSQLLRDHTPLPIANGESDADNWQLFQVIAEAIPEGAEVVFDITHGFRSLPVIALLALSYLRVVKRVQLRGVVYGAWQPGRPADSPTPVFDLTPFVALLDWAQAAGRFQDTGDASLFKPLLSMNRAATYNGVARQLETLSLNLFSNRGTDIPEQAQKLTRMLEHARSGQLEVHQQPFGLVLERLEDQIRPLGAPAGDDRLTLQAQHALIHWYADRGHFPQALSLAREWLISVRQWHERGRVSLNEDERENINNDCKATTLGSKEENRAALAALPAHLQGFARVSHTVTQLRNDLMHFGFKDERTGARQFGAKVKEVLDALPAAVRPLGLELEGPGQA